MIALGRYLAADVLSSQRYLGPLLLYIAAVALLTDRGNSPILPSFALDATAVYIAGAWLTTVIHNSLDRTRRDVITVTTGSATRVLLAGVGLALLACVLLGLFGMGYATLVNGQGPHWADVLAGIEATLDCACVGVAIGTVCSSIVIPRTGFALGLALAIVVVVLLVRGLPPVNPVLRTMSASPHAAALFAPLVGYLAIAVVLLAAATAVNCDGPHRNRRSRGPVCARRATPDRRARRPRRPARSQARTRTASTSTSPHPREPAGRTGR